MIRQDIDDAIFADSATLMLIIASAADIATPLRLPAVTPLPMLPPWADFRQLTLPILMLPPLYATPIASSHTRRHFALRLLSML